MCKSKWTPLYMDTELCGACGTRRVMFCQSWEVLHETHPQAALRALGFEVKKEDAGSSEALGF